MTVAKAIAHDMLFWHVHECCITLKNKQRSQRSLAQETASKGKDVPQYSESSKPFLSQIHFMFYFWGTRNPIKSSRLRSLPNDMDGQDPGIHRSVAAIRMLKWIEMVPWSSCVVETRFSRGFSFNYCIVSELMIHKESWQSSVEVKNHVLFFDSFEFHGASNLLFLVAKDVEFSLLMAFEANCGLHHCHRLGFKGVYSLQLPTHPTNTSRNDQFLGRTTDSLEICFKQLVWQVSMLLAWQLCSVSLINVGISWCRANSFPRISLHFSSGNGGYLLAFTLVKSIKLNMTRKAVLNHGTMWSQSSASISCNSRASLLRSYACSRPKICSTFFQVPSKDPLKWIWNDKHHEFTRNTGTSFNLSEAHQTLELETQSWDFLHWNPSDELSLDHLLLDDHLPCSANLGERIVKSVNKKFDNSRRTVSGIICTYI